MKFLVAILAIGALTGCSRESAQLPMAPAPSTGPAPLDVDVKVIEAGGLCIDGATIQIVRAEGTGEPITQQTPCDAWSGGGGVTLRGLPHGIELTIRGAATGYAPREVSLVPLPVTGGYRLVVITLAKAL